MRIGHCCIWLDPDSRKTAELANASATVKHVSSLNRAEQGHYLRRAANKNLAALRASVATLVLMPPERRMFRITSGLFPLFTHAVGKPIYTDPQYRREWNYALARIGEEARAGDVRLSFHPGQFCVLSSASETVRAASIEEFEYHTACAVAMGFNGVDDDFSINVHGGPKYTGAASIDAWLPSWDKLSEAARNLITVENDEMSWPIHGIERLCLNFGMRMVPDIHHHWVATGNWLEPGAVIKTGWHSQPKVHVSSPLPLYLHTNGRLRDAPINFDLYKRFDYRLPDRPAGVTLARLREHSDYIYHPGMVHYLNRWVDAGWALQVEAKAKNLAADNLFEALTIYRSK